MKLYYSSTSPFARKVRITAELCELANDLELISTDVMTATDTYKRINPLIKLPALEMRDGTVLVNSPFICEYINSLSLTYKVLPSHSPERWSILNDQAIADGAMEAAVLRRYESQRPPDRRDSYFDMRQREKIINTLEYFENSISRFRQDWTLREISLVSLVGYLELRFSHEKLQDHFPRVYGWYYESLKTRDFLKKTQ